MLSIEANSRRNREVAEALRGLEDQIPFATALALTSTIKDGQGSVQGHMKQVFDRPTRFTLRGVRVKPAKKRDLSADLWLVDEATKGTPPSKYLGPQIEGGARRAKRHEVALRRAGILLPDQFTVPGEDARLNKSGNITGGMYTKILSALQAQLDTAQNTRGGGRFFLLRQKGKRTGIYQRTGKRRVKSILHIIDGPPQYRARLKMGPVVAKVVERRWPKHMTDAIQRAVSTARPRGRR